VTRFQLLTSKQWALSANLIAGLSVASILLPEAVAYAAIAHLQIQHAITAVLIGLICYACLGGSRFAIVSPTSSAAALLAAVVLSLKPINNGSTGLAFGLVILTGIGLLAFAQAGLGRLSAFISRPVLHGFSFALAITIIIKQLPHLLGLEVHSSNILYLILDIVRQTPNWSIWSLVTGLTALILLNLLKIFPKIPGAFLTLCLGIFISHTINLPAYHVAVVGIITLETPRLSLPQLSIENWLQLAEVACGLMMIIIAESLGSINSLAIKHGQSENPNRELFALGSANLLSGLFQGMPVGAGFSASTANEQAGASSKWSGGFAAAIILFVILFGKYWLALIPEPIVAAAVINALGHALNPKPLLHLWRIDRDQYLALAAAIAVLAFGVLHGMLIAIGLSLIGAIRTFSRPLVRELGELDNSRDYVDKQNHKNALSHAHILILRPEEPLFFASVEGVLADVQQVAQQNTSVQIVILSLEVSANLDSTAAECLLELNETFRQSNITLLLARVKDPIKALLLKIDKKRAFETRLFWSVHDAVVHAQTLIN